MNENITRDSDEKTLRIRVYGIVQGVGFRPTVSRHAVACRVRGSVCNKGPYVDIIAQGTEAETERFTELLRSKPPKRAVILKMDVREITDASVYGEFRIIESGKTKGDILISPDIAICGECARELFDPADRRYLHPFINCTCCGPRLTILDGLPYDRERTSMKKFPLCPACEKEYHDPASRRYDAQPVCCPDCGPEVYLLGRRERGREAITRARRILAGGGILAVKGIGGFHLCCDATSPEAVAELRRRKRRPAKPFAVMVRDEAAARRECVVPEELTEILTGHQKPILLFKKRPGGHVAEACAPENGKLGIMLPYAPVQMLLFTYDDGIRMPDCLVMTSGNESGAPICRDDPDAEASLGALCDGILSNNRDIRIRADDTVMDIFSGRPYMIRRSRGYAPLPFTCTAPEGRDFCVLGIGGELKNSFTIARGEFYYPSPYIGDLADIRTADALRESIGRMEELLEVRPQLVACDLHPRYHSTEIAEELGIPVIRVQHHYAHILSCLAEHDYRGRVIGVAFDGTGYGTDGAIWGGELLLASPEGFRRAGYIRPFWQTGGDLSVKEGWRVAVSLLAGLYPEEAEAERIAAALKLCQPEEFRLQYRLAVRHINGTVSTSAGRLFDAVSAVLGIRRQSSYEGDASTALQYRGELYQDGKMQAEPHQTKEPEQGVCREAGITPEEVSWQGSGASSGAEGEILILETERLVKQIIDGRLAGEEVDRLAWQFHDGLAELVTRACLRIREKEGDLPAVLSGGVFQNTLLLGLTKRKLEAEGVRVLIHSMIPPGDGGISMGQALYAMYHKEE